MKSYPEMLDEQIRRRDTINGDPEMNGLVSVALEWKRSLQPDRECAVRLEQRLQAYALQQNITQKMQENTYG